MYLCIFKYNEKGAYFMTHTIFKKGGALLISGLLLLSAAGCSDSENTVQSQISSISVSENISSESLKDTVNIAIPASPAGITAAALLEKSAGDAALNNYIGSVFPTNEEVSSKIASGEADVALLPIDEAVQLYQSSGGEIQLLALLSQSDFSIVTSDDTIQSITDLSEATIIATDETGLGGSMLSALLENADIAATFEYVSDEKSAAAKLMDGSATIACLSEPTTTDLLKEASFYAPIQLSNAWIDAFDGAFAPYSCLVVRKTFADNNSAKVYELLGEFSEATTISMDDPTSMAMFCDRQEILPMDTAQQVLSRCKPLFLSGLEMKETTSSFLETLSPSSPNFLAEGLPDDAFYRPEELSVENVNADPLFDETASIPTEIDSLESLAP